MGKIFGACFFLIGGSNVIDLFLSGMYSEQYVSLFFMLVITAIGGYLLIKPGKTKEQKQREWEEKDARMRKEAAEAIKQKELRSRTVETEHMVGIPRLPQGVACNVVFDEDCLTMKSLDSAFYLDYDKIIDMEVKTQVDIETHYVSSIGDAIAGEALFGTIGGVIGGRVQERMTEKRDEYLFIAYQGNNDIDYIVFHVIWAENDVNRLIQRYQKKFGGQGISLDL